MKDFLTAAYPWLIMGLCLAILCTKLGKKKEGEKIGNYMTEGMALGMMLSVALGRLGDMGTGTSLSVGMLIGMAIGSAIPKKDEEE